MQAQVAVGKAWQQLQYSSIQAKELHCSCYASWMPDAALSSSSPLLFGFLDWKIALAVVLALVLIAWGVKVWLQSRHQLHGSAKFFARNYLRPGYVEFTITNTKPERAAQLGKLFFADAQGLRAEVVPSKDNQGKPVRVLNTQNPSVVLRMTYAASNAGHLSPVHQANGKAEPWVQAWFTAAGNDSKLLEIEGAAQALEKLHQDKLTHDAVQTRFGAEEGAGSRKQRAAKPAPRRAAARPATVVAHPAGMPVAANGEHSAAAKRRRNKKRKAKK